jgi:hypothetical protein
MFPNGAPSLFSASATGFTAAITGGTGAYRNTDGQTKAE